MKRTTETSKAKEQMQTNESFRALLKEVSMHTTTHGKQCSLHGVSFEHPRFRGNLSLLDCLNSPTDTPKEKIMLGGG
jgi:hypothetical protein